MLTHDDGSWVLFTDVEPALRDSARLAWLMPVISGNDDGVANARTAALAIGLIRGLSGVALVDAAMQVCPS